MAVRVVGGRSFPLDGTSMSFLGFVRYISGDWTPPRQPTKDRPTRITRMTDPDKAKIMAAGGLFKAHLEAFDRWRLR